MGCTLPGCLSLVTQPLSPVCNVSSALYLYLSVYLHLSVYQVPICPPVCASVLLCTPVCASVLVYVLDFGLQTPRVSFSCHTAPASCVQCVICRCTCILECLPVIPVCVPLCAPVYASVIVCVPDFGLHTPRVSFLLSQGRVQCVTCLRTCILECLPSPVCVLGTYMCSCLCICSSVCT